MIALKKGTKPRKFAPRFSVDYREVNKYTKKDTFPTLHIHNTLEQLGDCPRYFTELDLFSRYHQLGMTLRAIEISAFITKDSLYEYLRMLFGMCNTSASFQRAINSIFTDIIGQHVLVYIDNITVYMRTFKEYLEVLQEVLE